MNNLRDHGLVELPADNIDTWIDMDLIPEKRVTKGVRQLDIPHLKGWIKIGTPIIRNLKAPDAPHCNGHDFRHVLIAASFRPEDGTPFGRIWIQVDLIPPKTAEAIAWSMLPRSETSMISVTRKVGLNTKIGLKWLSSGGDASREEKFTSSEPFLIAYNEMCSDPVWEFIETEHVHLIGVHRLHLVVRKTMKALVDSRLSVMATVKHKRFGLFTCRSRVHDTPSIPFVIP